MNSPFRPPAPVGSPDELRQYAADCLRLVRLYADHAQNCAELGHDEEFVVTTRKLIAAVKAAAATINDLRGRTCTDV